MFQKNIVCELHFDPNAQSVISRTITTTNLLLALLVMLLTYLSPANYDCICAVWIKSVLDPNTTVFALKHLY